MRELKFRGLSKYNREWVYGDLVHIHDSEGRAVAIKDTLYRVNDGRINLIPTVIIEGTEGQYTGLKDKNGVEIYEGDIVRSIEDYGTDQYPDERTVDSVVEFKGGAFYPVCDTCDGYEIIGNVHENPSLLDADARGEVPECPKCHVAHYPTCEQQGEVEP